MNRLFQYAAKIYSKFKKKIIKISSEKVVKNKLLAEDDDNCLKHVGALLAPRRAGRFGILDRWASRRPGRSSFLDSCSL